AESAAGGGDNLVGGFFHGVGDYEVQPRFHQDFFAFVHVGAFEAQYDRQLQVRFACGLNDTVGERVHAQDSAEDIDQHSFDVFVAEQNLEGVSDLLGVGATADIKKVCGHAAGVLDDVHGRHGEAGAVHHAADAAIELDVVQAVFRGLD